MDGVSETGKKAGKLLNDLQDISFFEIILVVAGSWLLIFAMQRFVPRLANRGPNQLRLYLLGAVPILRLVLLVGAILWIIPIIFNITLQNFLVIAGAASVAIGFAFKDYVSSLIAGIVAIIERPYRPGDWVTIDGDYGEVTNVGTRALRMVTASDDVVVVPHDRIWSENIRNSNDGSGTLMCVTDFYVHPDHDAVRLRAILKDVALTSAYLKYDKPVHVMLSQTPFATHYKVKAYPYDLRDQFSFISDITVRGKRAIATVGAVEVSAAIAVE